MKFKTLASTVIVMAMLTPNTLKADLKPASTPNHQSSISLYGSTLLLASVANISFERLWRPSETSPLRLGVTTGYTMSFMHWSGDLDNIGMGPHLAFTLLAGNNNKFFEMKLGFTPIFSISDFFIEHDYNMPVISLGFRRQFPETNHFFRVGLSTAGIGIGAGFLL